MHVSANRAVLIISGLTTVLVVAGGALAVGLHQGWVRVTPTDAIAPLPQARVDATEAVRPPAQEPAVRPAPAASAVQEEAALYRQKLEESYRALDEAYAQIRALQSSQVQLSAARDDRDRFRERDDDDDDDAPRGRRFDRRRSRDD